MGLSDDGGPGHVVSLDRAVPSAPSVHRDSPSAASGEALLVPRAVRPTGAALLVRWRQVGRGYDGLILVAAPDDGGWALTEMWVESNMLEPA